MSRNRFTNKHAFLTTGVVLIVLSVAMPTAYADTLLDPHVTGSGTGSYTSNANFFQPNCGTTHNNAQIAFNATQKGITAPWRGTWTINDVMGGTLASGSILSGSTDSMVGGIILSGEETFGCGTVASQDVITITATCGTSSTISFSSNHVEKGSFTGTTHCGFPK